MYAVESVLELEDPAMVPLKTPEDRTVEWGQAETETEKEKKKNKKKRQRSALASFSVNRSTKPIGRETVGLTQSQGQGSWGETSWLSGGCR